MGLRRGIQTKYKKAIEKLVTEQAKYIVAYEECVKNHMAASAGMNRLNKQMQPYMNQIVCRKKTGKAAYDLIKNKIDEKEYDALPEKVRKAATKVYELSADYVQFASEANKWNGRLVKMQAKLDEYAGRLSKARKQLAAYLESKDVAKEMGKKDYKRWKGAYQTALAEL